MYPFRLFPFALLILGLILFSCEQDDLTPHYEAIFAENLVVQHDTAHVFEESIANVVVEGVIIKQVVQQSIGALVYVENKDKTNTLVFKPEFEILSYPDMELYLSSDSIYSNNDVKLPFPIKWGDQTTVVENLQDRPYVLAYRTSTQLLFSHDKFKLVQ